MTWGEFMQAILVLWACPASVLGLLAGSLGLPWAGGCFFRRGALVLYGGTARWALRRMPWPPRAMTLGHVVLAVDRQAAEQTFEHELIHVRQYERWGPAFIPAYLLCSLVVWLRGGHFYLDNPFELEAFQKAP